MRMTVAAVSRIAGHDGALDGGGAAPARQGRGVQVEAAVRAAPSSTGLGRISP